MSGISVLMPCRNAGEHLEASVRSAVEQFDGDDELVVQEACSDDGSAQLLDELAAADQRIRVRHERDDGQSDGLNRALARARNDMVCWLNADDLLLPGALAAARTAIRDRAPDLVVGGWRLITGDGTVIRDCPAEPLCRRSLLLRGCYVFSGALVMRAELVADCGGFATGLHYVMDFDLMRRLADRARCQVLVPTPMAALRYHEASKSGGVGHRFFTEGLAVRWRGLAGPDEALLAAAGSALHGVSVATARLRFSARYSRLRERATHR